MVARLAKSPGEPSALTQCIVDRDGPQGEVSGGRDRGGSQRDARAGHYGWGSWIP